MEIDTILTCFGLAMQAYSLADKSKVIQSKDYRKNLREIVSLLHYSKCIHNLSHTIIDLDYTQVFDLNAADVGILEISKIINNTFGKIYHEEISNYIMPKTLYYSKHLEPRKMELNLSNFPQSVLDSLTSLNKCFPKMISTYSILESTISEIYHEFINIEFSPVLSIKQEKVFKKKCGQWKHYIQFKNRELLTYADKNIFDSITVLDYLFVTER